MSRYIDADLSDEIIKTELGFYDTSELKEMLSYFPTADVKEVRHGKLFGTEVTALFSTKKCSCCRQYTPVGYYCYNCGAKMDGGTG